MIKSPTLLFPDDVKIFCPIVDQLSALLLQQDLLALKEWSKKWLLKFNITKTVVMHLGNTNQCYTYIHIIWMNSHYKLCQNIRIWVS